jgi:hypothetical protein
MNYTAIPPDHAYHGSADIRPLATGMPPAKNCLWFTRVKWEDHDTWMNGGPHLEAGIPYANIVWEAAGLRDRKRNPDGVAPWAREIRTHDELAEKFGILFITDELRAAKRYGKAYEIDLEAAGIVDVIEDPHVRTHRGWILIIGTGSQIPLTKMPAHIEIRN